MKKLLYAVFGIFIVALAGVAAIISFIDPNQLKPFLVQQVQEKMGRELLIDGDISWKFFPSLGLSVQQAYLKHPAHFPAGNTLAIEYAQINVALWPLVQKKIKLKDLQLSSVAIHIIKDKHGSNNLSFTQPTSVVKTEKSPTDLQTQDWRVQSRFSFDLALDAISVDQASLLFEDQQTQQKTSISELSFGIFNLEPGQTGELVLDAKLMQAQTKARVKLEGKVIPNQTFDIFGFQGLKFVWQLDADNLPEDFKSGELVTDGQIALGSQRFTFENLRLLAGDIDLKGNIAYEGTKVPTIKAQLSSHFLNIDKLLQTSVAIPPETSTSSNSSKVTDTAVGSVPTKKQVLDLGFLKQFNLDGHVQIDHLTFHGAQLQKAQLKFENKAGLLELKQVEAQLYQGEVKALGTLDVRREPAIFTIKKEIKGVQLHRLLQDSTNFKHLSGIAHIEVDLQGQGITTDTIRRTLSGDVHVQVEQGELIGVDFIHLLTALLQKNKDVNNSESKTKFSDLEMQFSLAKGSANADSIRFQSPVLQATGWGRTNLIDESLDFMLDVVFDDSLLVGEAQRFRGRAIPIHVQGDWSQPRYFINADKLLKQQASQAYDQLKEKLQDKLNKKLGDLFR